MKKYLIFCFIVIYNLCQSNLFAQQITVNAQIDSTIMWIGNQTLLSFEISQQANQKIISPIFSDTIVGGLEIVQPLKIDTVISQNGIILVKQKYLVTAFDDSLLYIPPFPFINGQDTVWSKSLSLKVVQPFQIDTASNQIADIKPVLSPKFNWRGILKTALIALIIVLLLIILFFIVRRFIQKKPIFENFVAQPDLPPYEVAISKLDKIKKEKLWQQNRPKEFQTELTDVLREYIEKVFEIKSMEMTSEEILVHLNHLRFESKSAYTGLSQILKLADLVKFAKWDASPDEHENSLSNSYLFINQTKIEEVLTPEEIETTTIEKL